MSYCWARGSRSRPCRLTPEFRPPGDDLGLAQYRATLDVWRALQVQDQIVFLYLNPDASPQGGMELLGTKVIRVSRREDEWTHDRTTFPLQGLPIGYWGVAGKSMAILWCFILESGLKVARDYTASSQVF